MFTNTAGRSIRQETQESSACFEGFVAQSLRLLIFFWLRVSDGADQKFFQIHCQRDNRAVAPHHYICHFGLHNTWDHALKVVRMF